ncbi:MAG TPA: HAMP domain-containing histidine kinase [Candidatus Blautia faecipullorum]|nr:HAMP domain-containing histidine kinase [Candidatus Blautia faecipullorum]
MEKLCRDTLTAKMVKRLVKGIAAGAFVFCVVYLGSTEWLNEYFFSSGYFYNAELHRAEELQSFVNKYEVSTEDTDRLRKWAKNRNIDEFTISREQLLLFDLSYDGGIRPGAVKFRERGWRNLYTVAFADGRAEVYFYEGFAEKYYDILLIGSIVLGFSVCLGIFISSLQEEVKYIQELEAQVEVISRGDLEGQVSVRGRDELAQLAVGLDRMRRMLIQKEETEREMRQAQEKLVLGMSHDLRTPLTSLMAYLEIARRKVKTDREYIDKALEKVLQLRSMSDQMFEYFLVSFTRETELEPEEEVRSALGDYLSEFCAMLEYSGFSVDAEKIKWKTVYVRIHTDYMGRIMNNLISNIQKYADSREKIELGLIYEPWRVGIFIKNKIARPDSSIQGTGIGVKNIYNMMEQMKGGAEVADGGDFYKIILWFPI